MDCTLYPQALRLPITTAGGGSLTASATGCRSSSRSDWPTNSDGQSQCVISRRRTANGTRSSATRSATSGQTGAAGPRSATTLSSTRWPLWLPARPPPAAPGPTPTAIPSASGSVKARWKTYPCAGNAFTTNEAPPPWQGCDSHFFVASAPPCFQSCLLSAKTNRLRRAPTHSGDVFP